MFRIPFAFDDKAVTFPFIFIVLAIHSSFYMYKFCMILVGALLSVASVAQDNFRFTPYGENFGLPQNSIYDIAQDQKGFIWIGTAEGLCRFDGFQMKVYKQSPTDPRAIPSYKEFRFYTDNDKRLWIVSFNGISLYNPITDDFTNVLVYTPRNVVIAKNHFFGEDNDFIWIGLCSYGLVKVQKKTLKVTTTSLTRTSLRPSNNVGYHGFLEKGKIWLIDNNESAAPVFSMYDVATQKTDTVRIPLNNIINLNDSQALGLTASKALLINKKTLAHQAIDITGTGKEHHVTGMSKVSASEVILSSITHGLYYVDTKQARVTKHFFYADPENKKTILYPRCTFTDRSGNTWVGTRGEGVFKLSYQHKKFQWYRSDHAANNNVFGLYADNTHVYASLLSSGMIKFSRSGKDTAVNIPLAKNIRNAVNNAAIINGLGKDKLVIMVNGTVNNGCSIPAIYTKSTGTLEAMNPEVQQFFANHWGRGNLRHFIIKDANENLYTNAGEYLVVISPCAKEGFCAQLLGQFKNETLCSGFIDNNGNIWVGSFTGVYKQVGGKWEKVHLPENKEVKSMCQDNDGNMWLGSNDDIVVINSDQKVINRFTEDNGLLNAHIYSILKDEDGNMWFSHNKGLTVYRWKEKRFDHFSKDDGLQSSEFNVGASFRAADGQLFFGGINGITGFYPRQIGRNPYAPAVQITGIKIYDEPYQTDIAYWNIRKLELPYTENSISFEFALPEYTNQLRNRYQFIMEGVDEKWIDGGDRRFTRYAGLQPGHYTFRVKGINNDGVVSSAITSVDILIVPPFWQRPWFVAIAGLLFVALSVGAGILIQKFRQRKAMMLLELQRKVQFERERISRDLHDNVGTQLSLINKNIENAINPLQDIPEPERLKRLGKISQTSKEVIFTLRETIWALNKEQISLEELSDKLKSFTQKIFELNPSCRLVYSGEIVEDVVLSPSEAIHLFRICQEAIANSLKYAQASSMQINISAINGKYQVSITDDGIGFEETIAQTRPHYGLENMQHRAAEIGCVFSIRSQPGQGTTIIISKK